MAYKITFKRDGSHYKLKDGFVLKDELNETLDSGLITFYANYSLDDIEPFDNVSIEEDNFTHLTSEKKILVDSYDEDIANFGSNYASGDYKYTMTLFSETKELERIVLPNCSVTQPINGGNTHSVLEEIKRFVNLYGTKIKVGTNEEFEYYDKYAIALRVINKFNNVVCPEFQWNRPTLREVLNDLMSTQDCIVVLKDNEIDYIDLKEKGSQIDTTKLLYSKRSVKSDDYVGELSIDMQNAIGKKRTTVCEYISLRAPDGEATMTTENCVIRTQHPIYEVKKLEICTKSKRYLGRTEVENIWVNIDFFSHVCEKEEWELLSNVAVDSTAWGSLLTFDGVESGNDEQSDGLNGKWKLHKLNMLYYERGKSEIKNIGTLYNTRPLEIGDEYFSKHVIASCVMKILGALYSVSYNPREMIIKVEYETVMEHSMNVGRYLPNHHPNNRIVDNQTNSYVDIEHQSVFEYAKANRLGNKIREIGGNYSKDSQVPQLGDRIGDEILFSRELCYWDNMVQFKGYLAPNYVLKDFFTGVAAKKRSWQIASGSDALTRHDVYKIYVEASFKGKRDNWDEDTNLPIIEASTIAGFLINYLVSCFDSYTSFGGVKYAVCSTVNSNGIYYPNKSSVRAEVIALDTNVEIQGMSLCFNFGYNDNFKSADYISENGGEYKQMFYSYADRNGEFTKHQIELLGDFWGLGDGQTDFNPDPTQTTEVGDETVSNMARQKPKLSVYGAEYENKGITLEVNVNKDNREIIQHSIQFEYCSDTKDIIVGRKMIELCKLFNESNLSISNLRLHWSTTEGDHYELGQEKDRGLNSVALSSSNISVSILDDYGMVIENTRTPNTSFTCWSITDSQNNIIVAVNGNVRSVYFNLLRDRDTKIYASDKKTIVGELGD